MLIKLSNVLSLDVPASTTWSRVGNLCLTADEIDLKTKEENKKINILEKNIN